jgi:hypothetical protein
MAYIKAAFTTLLKKNIDIMIEQVYLDMIVFFCQDQILKVQKSSQTVFLLSRNFQ